VSEHLWPTRSRKCGDRILGNPSNYPNGEVNETSKPKNRGWRTKQLVVWAVNQSPSVGKKKVFYMAKKRSYSDIGFSDRIAAADEMGHSGVRNLSWQRATK